MNELSAQDEANFWGELQQRDASFAQYRASAAANPAIASNLVAIHSAAPDAAPGVKLSLAQASAAGVLPQVAAIKAALASYSVKVEAAARPAASSSFIERVGHDPISESLYNVGKGVVRTGLGVLQSGAQGLQSAVVSVRQQENYANKLTPEQAGQLQARYGATPTGVRTPEEQAAGPPHEATVGDIFRSTTLGQQVSDLAGNGTTDQGSGFFPGGAAEIKRRETERAVRGIIPGSGRLDAAGNVIPGSEQTATIGRSIASSVVEPGTAAYRLMSGAADAYIAWYQDPANIALKGLTAVRGTRNVITAAKALESSDLAKVLRPGEAIVNDAKKGAGVWRNVMATPTFVPYADVAAEARATRAAEAGVIESHRFTVAPQQAEAWTLSKTGQDTINSIAGDDNFLSIHNALGRKVAPEVVAALADAKDPTAVRELLLGELGTSLRSTTDISKVKAPNWWQSTRASQLMPKTHLSTGYNASTAERIDAVNNLDAYLANAKVPFEARAKIVGDFGKGLVSNAQDRYQALTNAMDAVESSLKAYGVDPGVARSLTHFSGDAEAVRKYAVDALGRPTDAGFLENLKGQGYKFGDGTETLQAIGPQLLSEGLGDTAYLPNIREVRRLTSKLAPLTAIGGKAGAGELRTPLAAIEHFQNAVIKPLAIIRPAFLLRVIGEEQFRMAAAGQASIVRHPIEWIQYAMHNSGSFDALGQDFAALADHAEDYKKWDEFSASLHRGLNAVGGKHVIDPLVAERSSYLTGSWTTVDKHINPSQWEMGHSDELRQLHNDQFASRIAQGQTNDEITAWLRGTDPEAQRSSAELKNLLANKAARDSNGKWVRAYSNSDDDVVLHAYLDSVRERVATKVGQNPDLLGAIAHGTVGHAEQTVANGDLTVIKAGPRVEADPFNPGAGASTWVGSKVKLSDGTIATITNNADEAGHSIVQTGGQAWDRAGRTSPQLRAAVKDWRADEASPQVVKYAVRANERVAGYRGEAAAGMAKMRDKVVNGFFSGMYGRSSDYLSRSPAFRQFYWQRATELADQLSPTEANAFLHSMQAAADTHAENSVAKLLGGNQAVDAAIAKAGRADGTLTLAQLDDYARGHALDSTKQLLYDASRRSQFFDVARVVFPFGEAWKEVIGAWTKAISRDPRLVRRSQLIVQGGRDADPDGNGQGFFHVDPSTGKEVFTIPFSPEVSRFLTGKNPVTDTLSHVPGVGRLIADSPAPTSQDLNVPLKGLNIGMSVMPGIGWVASAALGQIIPNKPAFDDVRSFLMPYGASQLTGAQIAPSWLQKIAGGVTDSPNSTRIYGDTYMRTVQALVASGKYGNSADEQDRLKRDATAQARVLTIIRGVAQATGPAAPSVDFHVATTQGDAMASGLTKEYARMVKEDPQNALENFQALYGDLATSFAVSRTRAVNGGLDDSKQFGNWERSHGKVFSAAPDVAGYFAPVGTDFDFAVYDRQLKSGQREKLSADQYLSAVNETIGNRIYYALRDAVTARNDAVGRKTLDASQTAYLRDAKAKILERWPVPNPAANDRAALPDQIRQLGDVIDSKPLAGNQIADAARQYLTIRNGVLAEVANRGGASLSGQKMEDLRAYLTAAGTKLVQQTPSFSRLWDRVLAREVQ